MDTEEVPKTSFYPREQAAVNKELFENCFRVVAFSLTDEELDVVWRDLGGDEVGTIELSQFYSKLSCWNENVEKSVEELDKKDEDAMDDLNAEFFQVLSFARSVGSG